MDKMIKVSADVRSKIMKAFGVTSKTVYNALSYNSERGNTDLAKKIRVMALNNGGVPTVSLPECECLHDEVKGLMVQTFNNGAVLTIDKHTGNAEVKDPKGKVRMRKEKISIPQLYVLQEYAAAF